MNIKKYLLTLEILFDLIALAHLLRFIFGWEVVIQGFVVPSWVSLVVFIVMLLLARQAFKLRKDI
ncbi:MAG: hypothetical protein AAB693_01215 [Patescibacteria group bacterium]